MTEHTHTPNGLLVVSAKIDGAIYWLATKTGAHEEVLALVNGDASTEDAFTTEDVSKLRVLSESECRGLTIRDEDGPLQDLWSFAGTSTEPGIIACSEWP